MAKPKGRSLASRWMGLAFVALGASAPAGGFAQPASQPLNPSGPVVTSAPPKPVLGPSPGRMLSGQLWVRQPSVQDIVAVYPEAARKAGLTGSASLHCIVGPKGVFMNCKVHRQWPEEAGFGEAALKLADRYKVKTRSLDGYNVIGAWTIVTVRFPPKVAP